MKTYKLIGLDYYAVNCRSVFHALTTFLQNRCGVTIHNIEEFTGNIPENSTIFKGI